MKDPQGARMSGTHSRRDRRERERESAETETVTVQGARVEGRGGGRHAHARVPCTRAISLPHPRRGNSFFSRSRRARSRRRKRRRAWGGGEEGNSPLARTGGVSYLAIERLRQSDDTGARIDDEMIRQLYAVLHRRTFGIVALQDEHLRADLGRLRERQTRRVSAGLQDRRLVHVVTR